MQSNKAIKFAALGMIALTIGMSALAWVPTASAAQNTLYFRDTNVDLSGTTYDGKAATIGALGSNTNTITITVGGTATAYWWGDAASVATTPETGGWILKVWTRITPSALSTAVLTATLVQYTQAGTYSAISGASQLASVSFIAPEITATSHTVTLTPSSSLSIAQGTRIGVQITITGGTSNSIIYYDDTTNGRDSSLATPNYSDPVYPVPELSTIILMTSGLVVGVGMLAYSNKKKK